MIPGEWFIAEEPIEINPGRPVATVRVRNTGDRPIQVGSHYHFFETNPALHFDRRQALGKRLNIPAGQTLRFERNAESDVELVAFGGAGRIEGFHRLVDGSIGGRDSVKRAVRRASERGFAGATDPSEEQQ